MDKSILNIAIVGGSLSGLIHGVALKRQRHKVQIFERSSTSLVSTQGAGLNAGRDVQRFMQEFDRTGLPYYLSPPSAQIMNSDGKVTRNMESDQKSTDWSTLYYRLRANFDGLQTGYCEAPPKNEGDGPALYMDGYSVTSVKYEHGLLTVEFYDLDGSTGSVNADLVIAADGPGSTVRQSMAPEAERKYVGYCGWRGTVPEEKISEETKTAYHESSTLCAIQKSYFISYLIPGESGDLQPGSRQYNWAWFRQYSEDSSELQDVLTDKDGKKHRYTLPIGKIQEKAMEQQKVRASELLPSCATELISKTENVFIQAITDVVSPKATFFDGKVLLVGDALATFPPITGLGTNQAARQALSLLDVLAGQSSLEEWERNALEYAQATRALGMERERLFRLR
ncbi:hypothetical protein F5884DRAFT_404050 [Xylogone sp. PMI_703]|nr:hypothetical protein F5884DRAFT_404050 [Xylogone sp. PMI_703]